MQDSAQTGAGGSREIEPPFAPIYGDYAGRMPRFYDPAALPFAASVEAAAGAIRDEVLTVLRGPGAPLRPNWDPYDFRVGGWRSANLVTYTHWYPENAAAFPLTTHILTSIPHLTSAFVNVLEPRTRVPSHCGDSNTTWRCHLPLLVPRAGHQCAIEVGGERRHWEEGRLLAFCDAHRHSAWNDSDEPRVVLVFDVMRPEYVARKAQLCAWALGSIALTLAQTRVPPLRRLPAPVLRTLHATVAVLFRARLALRARRQHRRRVPSQSW